MSSILFYSPFNQRSRDTESLMIAFKRQGHRVISLSQSGGYLIHPYLRSHQIETLEHQISARFTFLFYIRHILFFIQYCRLSKVEVVYCHLESSCFVGAISQFFVSAKVFICRHHIDEAALQGFDKSVFYKLTYRLAKKIIVVSDQAKSYMERVEKIPASKITKINLAYDFSLYAKPDQEIVSKVRREISADIILLTVCRLTKYKRPDLSIKVLKRLVNSGWNAKLIILGKGEEELNLKGLAEAEGILSRVMLPGYVNNITDYLAASDFLLHPSVLESSCVTVKEAAITNLPIIICKDVGDFNDYINSENGFAVSKDNFVQEATDILLANYQNKEKLRHLTRNLQAKVRERFDVNSIINQYSELNTHD